MPRVSEEKAALLELARRKAREHFPAFIRAVWPHYEFSRSGYHERLTEKLHRVGRGEITRLMVNVPPRHSKSLTGSILFPAWWIGNHPKKEVILASYSAELAQGFSRRVREVIQSKPFREIFPEVRLSDRATAVQLWETTEGGRFLAQGVGGSITGFGADLLIVEDPVSGREDAESSAMSLKLWDWWTSVAFTRLHPEACILLIGTRWAMNDLFGRILDGDDADQWERLHLPALNAKGEALWPERYDADYLKQTGKIIGPYDWQSLYMGEPYHRGGKYIKTDSLKFLEPDQAPEGLRVFRVIDVATTAKKTSDFSVSLKVGFRKVDGVPAYFILDGWHLRAEWPQVRQRILNDVETDGPGVEVFMEAQAGFLAAYQDLRKNLLGRCRVNKLTVQKDKLSRALGWISAIEAGHVYVVRSPSRDSWQSEFLKQLQAFPSKNVHDDYPDAMSLMMMASTRGGGSRMVFMNDMPGSSPAMIRRW